MPLLREASAAFGPFSSSVPAQLYRGVLVGLLFQFQVIWSTKEVNENFVCAESPRL